MRLLLLGISQYMPLVDAARAYMVRRVRLGLMVELVDQAVAPIRAAVLLAARACASLGRASALLPSARSRLLRRLARVEVGLGRDGRGRGRVGLHAGVNGGDSCGEGCAARATSRLSGRAEAGVVVVRLSLGPGRSRIGRRVSS